MSTSVAWRLLLASALAVTWLAFAAVAPLDRDRVAAVGRATVSLARVVPRFGHAVVVVFENHSASRILGQTGSPFRWLAHRYARLTRYDAVAHPSLPNYLALVSGSTQGVHHDCTRCVFRGPTLAGTLAAHSRTWKMYVEHLPLYRSQGARITGPEKARLPFLYFGGRAARRVTVPLSVFFRDLRARRLPSFSLVIPDLCHDMHSCSVATGDRWLRRFLRPLLEPGALRRTAVFIVFDEGPRHDTGGGGGRVAAIVAGPLVRPHSVSVAPLDHYSLLRTIEDAFGLPAIGHSAAARPITGIWRGP